MAIPLFQKSSIGWASIIVVAASFCSSIGNVSSFAIPTVVTPSAHSTGGLFLSSLLRQRETLRLDFHQDIDKICRPARSSTRTSTTTQLHCICVHCKYVTECSAYHFVETRHNQPHMTETPTFTPRDGSPTIHVNVRMLSRDDEQQQQQSPQESASAGSSGGDPAAMTAPAVTYEYDVVKCADFVEDRDCWVRNMPEAIRIANPHFVPT